MPITAVILAGGQSLRMGTDKATLEVSGVTLLERTAQIALAADLPVLVAGRARPSGWALEAAAFAEDRVPGLGPLGGLATAFTKCRSSVLALACDLPLLTEDSLRWLRDQAEQKAERGVITVNNGQWEPLFSIYHRACLPLAEARLAEGKRSLHGLIKDGLNEAGQFAFVDAPQWIADLLVNVNTPVQWQALQEDVGY